MPKRKIKEEKPLRKFGKKEMLIAPIAIGAGMLATFVIIPTFFPPPSPINVCLKALNVENFQLFPRVKIVVDGKQVWLPADVGREPQNGKDCVRPIRTDQIGNIVHIEYIRAIRFTMADFMKVYTNGSSIITVVDNSTGPNHSYENRTLNLADYDIQYSYFSNGQFVPVSQASDMPAFPADNNFVGRLQLTKK